MTAEQCRSRLNPICAQKPVCQPDAPLPVSLFPRFGHSRLQNRETCMPRACRHGCVSREGRTPAKHASCAGLPQKAGALGPTHRGPRPGRCAGRCTPGSQLGQRLSSRSTHILGILPNRDGWPYPRHRTGRRSANSQPSGKKALIRNAVRACRACSSRPSAALRAESALIHSRGRKSACAAAFLRPTAPVHHRRI